MKLLLDQGLPRSTAAILRELGIGTTHVGKVSLAEVTDAASIEYAREHGYSIVTLDADFQSLIATSSVGSPSVIRLRVQRLKAPEAVRLLEALLRRVGAELEQGCFVTASRDSLRLRRLPIVRRRH